MEFMMAFGWASVMLIIGVLLRAKVSFLRTMLVPASVVAGIIGFVAINILWGYGIDIGTKGDMFTEIVNHLFTISFISITLTSTKLVGKKRNSVLQGALGMGIVWCILYALTPLLGTMIVSLVGRRVKMDAMYGMLIQFGFCQGPGQAAAFGELFEQFGWKNATTVGISFSVIGFIAAFLIGIPFAKLGIKKGIAKNCGDIDATILKGYYSKDEQKTTLVKDTTCNSNIETLTFHLAVIGVCYVMAIGISKILGFIPGFLGTSMSGMMFMNGMYAAYIMKFVLNKLNLEFLIDDTLQSKITGWTADYLVVCAFMAVEIEIIRAWIAPIIIVSAVVTIVTAWTCIYFGSRIGGTNDFERILGLYGMCTGTVPSGLALIRIVDPNFDTTTAIELGACNLIMIACTPVYIVILGLAAGSFSIHLAMVLLVVCCLVYLMLLKITKCWGKQTISWK